MNYRTWQRNCNYWSSTAAAPKRSATSICSELIQGHRMIYLHARAVLANLTQDRTDVQPRVVGGSAYCGVDPTNPAPAV